MLAALNKKEVHSKLSKDKYHDIPQYKMDGLDMMKNFIKNQIGMQSTYLILEL